MAVYVDDAGIMWKGRRRYHLTADSLDELHAFAKRIGVHECWFHKPRRHPHYDVTEVQRTAALVEGAEAVSTRKLVVIAKRLVGA